MSATTPAVTPELKQLLRRVKLGKSLDTLPDRLTLARQSKLSHAEFLELVLADEVDRRNRQSTARTGRHRQTRSGHDARQLGPGRGRDLRPRHVDRARLAAVRRRRPHVLVLGPVGVGKTHLAHALGHIACRRGRRVHAERAERLFKRLKAARLDHSHDVEMRRLITVDVLIIDDFALQGLDPVETTDFYEIVVERHLMSATVITSNRDPNEWLAALAAPLLAQSAIDRLQSSAWELVIEGESYRRRQKPTLTTAKTTAKEARR